jgi:hypothetical protein
MVSVLAGEHLTGPSARTGFGEGRRDADHRVRSAGMPGRVPNLRDRRERRNAIRTITDAELDGVRSVADEAGRGVGMRGREGVA